MHFSKTYAQILLGLPSNLRDHVIQYRQLKKLINGVVNDLQLLGLHPMHPHDLLTIPKVPTEPHSTGEEFRVIYHVDEEGNITSSLQLSHSQEETPDNHLFPLPNNDSFFNLLYATLSTIQRQVPEIQRGFESQITMLADNIGRTALPLHEVNRNEKFYSAVKTDPTALRSTHPNFHPSLTFKARKLETDLSTWRKLFQIYIQVSPFQSFTEGSSGDRVYEDSLNRLKILRAEIDKIKPQFHDILSAKTVESFWDLNMMILDVKNFSLANSEALRKILKKHAKKTSLPPPPQSMGDSVSPPLSINSDQHLSQEALPGSVQPEITDSDMSMIPRPKENFKTTGPSLPIFHLADFKMDSLPRSLIQAIGDRLLVVVPSIDDYSCAICTSLAFKPIRLSCQHLFCVRCLVKMQKRGQGECPLCRKDVVLQANRSNVDWALLNFMKDWFPDEAREKGKENELEAAVEGQRERYASRNEPEPPCVIS